MKLNFQVIERCSYIYVYIIYIPEFNSNGFWIAASQHQPWKVPEPHKFCCKKHRIYSEQCIGTPTCNPVNCIRKIRMKREYNAICLMCHTGFNRIRQLIKWCQIERGNNLHICIYTILHWGLYSILTSLMKNIIGRNNNSLCQKKDWRFSTIVQLYDNI